MKWASNLVERVAEPLARRVGTAAACVLAGVGLENPDLLHRAEVAVAALVLVVIDLILDRLHSKRVMAKVFKSGRS